MTAGLDREFKPFDRVIYRTQDGFWNCGLYSHKDDRHHYLVGAIIVWKEHDLILPYEGNEYLIGTMDFPVETFLLKERELIFAFNSPDSLSDGYAFLGRYKSLENNRIIVYLNNDSSMGGFRCCIPYSKFNPQNKVATTREILTAKDGKLVRMFRLKKE